MFSHVLWNDIKQRHKNPAHKPAPNKPWYSLSFVLCYIYNTEYELTNTSFSCYNLATVQLSPSKVKTLFMKNNLSFFLREHATKCIAIVNEEVEWRSPRSLLS